MFKKTWRKNKKKKNKNYLIHGNGLNSLILKKNSSLNFGNSGTLARLLTGILSTTTNIKANLVGDHSLNKRSMKKLINLMEKFGASFSPKNKFYFPLKLTSSEFPIGIKYNAGVSAQLKSAVMLAGLNAYGNTTINEIQRSRDHTENMLSSCPGIIKVSNKSKKTITIFGKKILKPSEINVPNDPSSAAFFTALTLLNENSSLTMKNVGLNPTRTGFYQLLKNKGKNKI